MRRVGNGSLPYGPLVQYNALAIRNFGGLAKGGLQERRRRRDKMREDKTFRKRRFFVNDGVDTMRQSKMR